MVVLHSFPIKEHGVLHVELAATLQKPHHEELMVGSRYTEPWTAIKREDEARQRVDSSFIRLRSLKRASRVFGREERQVVFREEQRNAGEIIRIDLANSFRVLVGVILRNGRQGEHLLCLPPDVDR